MWAKQTGEMKWLRTDMQNKGLQEKLTKRKDKKRQRET